VILVGGPGQAATEAGAMVAEALHKVHRKRDMVLIDQRGTGASNPLDCELGGGDEDLAKAFRGDALPAEDLRRCLAKLDADPRLYTTAIAMDDLDEVREKLGYARVNLWGGSYGTRAALVYMRRHPEHVRTAVLDGVAPPTMPLPLYFARDAERSMAILVADCAAEPSCAAQYPDLAGELKALLGQLEAQAAKVEVNHPRSGEPVKIEISRDAFAGNLRGFLYAGELQSLVPLIIKSARGGNFAPFVAASFTLAQGVEKSMSLGMTLSVVCAEDAPDIAPGETARLAQGSFLGEAVARQFAEACAVWPRGEVAKDHAEPVRSDLPVLLLSGELDPVTPPSWAEEAAKTLKNATTVVVAKQGHGVTMRGCVPTLVNDFYERASGEALDRECLKPMGRSPFFVSFAGPTP